MTGNHPTKKVVILEEELGFEKLRFAFCGRQECAPLHSWGPGIKPCYIIHCVTEGRGIFRLEDQTFSLGKGEGFLITPQEQVFYSASADTPWHYCWIGFDGAGVPLLLREIGISREHPTFRFSRGSAISSIVEEMLFCRQQTLKDTLRLQSLLYQLFVTLLEETSIGSTSSVREKSPGRHVQEALRFIRNHYRDGINVSDVARYIGINRSYLYTLFRQELQTSPSQCLEEIRLTHGAEMLGITRDTLEQVAISCGYSDPAVFAKAFRKKYGLTPSQYRAREQKEQERIRESLLIR